MASPSITSNNSDTGNCNSCVTVSPQLGGKTSSSSTSTVNSSTTSSSCQQQQQQSHQQALTTSSSDLTNLTIVSPVPPGVQTGVPHRSGIEFNFQQQLFQLKQQQQLQQQLLLQQFQQQQARLAEQHEKQLHERIRVRGK